MAAIAITLSSWRTVSTNQLIIQTIKTKNKSLNTQSEMDEKSLATSIQLHLMKVWHDRFSTMDFRGGYKYKCELGSVYVLYTRCCVRSHSISHSISFGCFGAYACMSLCALLYFSARASVPLYLSIGVCLSLRVCLCLCQLVCGCVCAHLPKCGRATGEVLNDGQVLTNVGPVWKTYLSNMHAYQQPTIKAYQFFQKVFLISFKFHSVLPFFLSVELLFGVWHTNVGHCRISI